MKSIPVDRWVMFQKEMASTSRETAMTSLRSTLRVTIPETGIINSVTAPPRVMARPALVAV